MNLLFNRTPRNLLLISTIMLAIVTPLLTTKHASATTPQALIGMPFTGQWAYNANVNPPYTDSNSSHPSVHHTPGGGNWATDVYAAEGTPVKLNVTYGTGPLSFSWISSSSCGQSTMLNVIVGGTTVGWLYFAHLNNAVTSGPITNGMTLGTVHDWGSTCNPGVHVHIEFHNSSNYSCYVDNGHPGVTLSYGTNFGVLGSSNTGPQQACTSIPSAPPPLTLRIGMVDNSNTFWVKENTPGALWDNENTGVSQGLVSGSLIADLVGGTFQVKQGTIGALWDNEDTGITQGSISDATATAPLRIGVLTSAGHFLVKEGDIGSTWDDEDSNIVAGYVSGSRIGVLTNTGSFLVKDGGLGAAWVDEYDGVSQGVLSGSLVGAVTTGGLFPCGTYIVKQGDLGQPWVNEYPNVSSGTLSDATSSTPLRIGALTTSGAYWVKEGDLGATWTNEYNSVSQGMLSGNLIGVLSGGTYLVKQGTTGATFINEQTSVVTSGTLWSLN